MPVSRRIAVLCESAERGQRIAGLLSNSSTEGQACQSSDELHRVVTTGKIDAIIIDQRQSGFLTGLDIMSRLVQDLVRPVTILVGDLSADEKRQAAALQITACLPSYSDGEAIAAAACGALAQETNLKVNIPHGARLLVRDADCIAPMPQMLVRVSDFLNNPNATVSDLAQEILSDARMTAELMKIVNNTTMGLSSRVTRLQDAVNLIGIKRTVSLVLAAHLLGNQFRHQKRGLNGTQQLRQRSLLTASTAASYARMTGNPASDTAYVLGLMQDLGIQILLHELGDKYASALERCATIAHLQLILYERDEFGFTHADVSAALMQKWDMPLQLIRLVQQHHEPIDQVDVPPPELELLKAMQIGEAVSDCRERMSPHRQVLLNRLVARFDQLDPQTFRVCLAQAVERTMEMSRIFSMPLPDESSMRLVVDRLAEEAELPQPDLESEEITGTLELPWPGASDTTDIPPAADLLDDREIRPNECAAPAPGFYEPVRPELSRRDVFQIPEAPQLRPAFEPALPEPRLPQIVVIDDDPAIQHLIACMLAPYQIEVLGCTDPADIPRLPKTYCVILCEMHLQAMSGIDAIQFLRRQGVRTPLIVVSSDRSRETVIECISAGVADYLPKPFQQRTLLAKLKPHLGDWQSRSITSTSRGQVLPPVATMSLPGFDPAN